MIYKNNNFKEKQNVLTKEDFINDIKIFLQENKQFKKELKDALRDYIRDIVRKRYS